MCPRYDSRDGTENDFIATKQVLAGQSPAGVTHTVAQRGDGSLSWSSTGASVSYLPVGSLQSWRSLAYRVHQHPPLHGTWQRASESQDGQPAPAHDSAEGPLLLPFKLTLSPRQQLSMLPVGPTCR